MPLESVTYISDLVITNPTGGDQRYETDDHLRAIKKALRNTFPNINNPINTTPAELNHSIGVSSPIQGQINSIIAGTAVFTTLSGTGATYTGTLLPSITTYVLGAAYRVLCSTRNSVAAPTVALNGLAALIVTKQGGQPLAIGDMPAGGMLELVVTSSGFQLLNPAHGGIWTGTIVPTFRAIAQDGWLLMNDLTIGNAGSGATGRANNDTEALFIVLWDYVTNTYAPVSGGRGASAQADHAALKTIALPKMLGRAMCVAGSGAGLTVRGLGQTLGEETHLLTVAEMPTHKHTLVGDIISDGAGGIPTISVGPNDVSIRNVLTGGTNLSGAVENTGGGNQFNVMQPSVFVNAMIKL